jgi:hypothetical protein
VQVVGNKECAVSRDLMPHGYRVMPNRTSRGVAMSRQRG